MYKFYFSVSDTILSGCVACAYCKQTNIWKFQSLANHFKFRCEKICLLNDCDCNICTPQNPYIKLKDTANIYVNRKSAINYFFPSVEQYWGVTEPCFLIKDTDTGHIIMTSLTPAIVA